MDEPQALTVSLSPQDWQVIMRALYELPMKESAPVANRLQLALAAAQKPPQLHSVKGGDE